MLESRALLSVSNLAPARLESISPAIGLHRALADSASIFGKVFNDLNDNARYNPGEKPLPSRVVWLDTNDDRLLESGEPQTQTNATGAFRFTGLAPGDYTVNVIASNGWRLSLGSFSVSLSMAPNVTVIGVWIGLTRQIRLEGGVFLDGNENRVQDPGDVGLSGETIFLDQNHNARLDQGEQRFTSGSGGLFDQINLRAGHYDIDVIGDGFPAVLEQSVFLRRGSIYGATMPLTFSQVQIPFGFHRLSPSSGTFPVITRLIPW